MVLLFVLLALVLLVLILLFTVTSKLIFSFDTSRSDLHLTLLWLYPFFKSVVVNEDNGLVLNIYLLNKKVYSRQLRHKQNLQSNRSILRSFSPTDIHVDAQYGFRDPSVTGLACSVISAVSKFFNVESLRQEPDFLAYDDYIYVDATARLNLGHSLVKLIR